MRTCLSTQRSIRAAAWKARGGGSCRIARAARRRGTKQALDIAMFAALQVIRPPTRNASHAASDRISRWKNFLALQRLRNSSSGMRRSNRGQNRRFRLKSRLAKGREIILRAVEIAERCKLRI